MEGKTTQGLWQNYRFLTKEMLKFLTKQDMKLFYSLMEQRECLQTKIEEAADEGFKDSPSGQSLLAEIQQDNQLLIVKLQQRRNRFKQHHQVIGVYSAARTVPSTRKTWER